ncbi:MAG TPA: response regulator transcription factor [Candidatus Obscuribacterales bacterium]
MTIKIFIVEDDRVTREGVKALLKQVKDFDVVGDSADGTRAAQEVLRAQPDVMITDIGLPGINGIEVARVVKENAPKIKVLMFTSHDDEGDMFDAFGAGADGYIVKQAFALGRLQLAVSSLMEGHCWLDPLIAKRVLKFAVRGRMPTPTVVANAAHPLTLEEQEVLTEAECSDGVCSVDADFLRRLHRFAPNR